MPSSRAPGAEAAEAHQHVGGERAEHHRERGARGSATCRLIQAAPRICGSRKSSPYHLVEKPPQTVTSLLSLKLKTISDMIGA